jgi:hypothetical protein
MRLKVKIALLVGLSIVIAAVGLVVIRHRDAKVVRQDARSPANALRPKSIICIRS